MLPNSLKVNSEAILHTPAVPGAEEPQTPTLSLFRTQALLQFFFSSYADNVFLNREMEEAGSSF